MEAKVLGDTRKVPWAKDCTQHLEYGKGKKKEFSLESFRGSTALSTL